MKVGLAAVAMILLACATIWLWGPLILKDYQLSGQSLQPTTAFAVTDARCKTKVFFLSSCDVTLEPSAGRGAKQEFDYFILGRMGGESVYPMVDPATNAVTTNIGVEYITNRILMLVLLSGFLFVLGIGALAKVVSGARA